MNHKHAGTSSKNLAWNFRAACILKNISERKNARNTIHKILISCTKIYCKNIQDLDLKNIIVYIASLLGITTKDWEIQNYIFVNCLNMQCLIYYLTLFSIKS